MHLAPASLPALLSVLGCHMSTNFRLVRPRTTPYWERLGSDTILYVRFIHVSLPPEALPGAAPCQCPLHHASCTDVTPRPLDDAHIFCRETQIKDEVRNALSFINYVFNIFGFTYELKL
ncbi:hypothetical protein LR48_Vigan09g110500 [Vigna angularis]|uniref:Uncharacterized protein n=1 Tax=Phaseolus angularis TaxID=3914 RepID=A0A0L9VBL9_PHAAN|nr:hypothetical protein LR48_Vigan09g110500 [Vigna angularis]